MQSAVIAFTLKQSVIGLIMRLYFTHVCCAWAKSRHRKCIPYNESSILVNMCVNVCQFGNNLRAFDVVLMSRQL